MSDVQNVTTETAPETAPETTAAPTQPAPAAAAAPASRPPQTGRMKRFYDEDEYSAEDAARMEAMYAGTMTSIAENTIVRGRIEQMTDRDITINIGGKSVGVVARNEFARPDEIHVGDEVEVYLEHLENKDGQLAISRKRADYVRIWERLNNASTNDEIIVGRIMRRIKGGMVVDLFGVDAFLPGSQIDVRPVRDFDALIGQEMDFKIVKINQASENVVVSHKVLIEKDLLEQRAKILANLERGQILEGTVKNITDFGVFIDLGGVDGLLHITDLSWGRVGHPSEVVNLDQTLNVVVLDFNEDKNRISLGLKQLTPHPWENVADKYPVAAKITGKVVSITDYGAFVELEKGVEGLVHISEMSWTQHVKHPSQMVSIGQPVDVKILNVDREAKKISLGIKQLEPDPWQDLAARYPVGSRHNGRVRNLTNFGVFVELEPGIDGLVHISDLSWTKKVRHPGEVVKKGDELDVLVLGVDTSNRRISLGHKQVIDNPWEAFEMNYGVGTETDGKIVRIIEKGVIVELPMGVDGFVPSSHLTRGPVKDIAASFNVDDELPLKVIEFDKENKKIVLSVTEFLRGKDKAIVDEYLDKHPNQPAGSAIGDADGAETVSASDDSTDDNSTDDDQAS